MRGKRENEVAVIFLSERTGEDEPGYARAAARMSALAAEQPGYRGEEGARGADGRGVTVSYWADEASAVAWRDQPEHAAIREAGRARWYRWYQVNVTAVTRSYEWTRP